MKLLLILLLTVPLQASDLYVCWNYTPKTPVCQSPQSALTNWKPGDRIWLLGSNFKLLLAWDGNDAKFTSPAEVTITLKPESKLNVQVTKRKTNTSTNLPITVNKDTAVEVVR